MTGSEPLPVIDLAGTTFLAVTTADERDHSPTPRTLIELTVNEFRRLLDAPTLTTRQTMAALIAWSTWRSHTNSEPANATIYDENIQ